MTNCSSSVLTLNSFHVWFFWQNFCRQWESFGTMTNLKIVIWSNHVATGPAAALVCVWADRSTESKNTQDKLVCGYVYRGSRKTLKYWPGSLLWGFNRCRRRWFECFCGTTLQLTHAAKHWSSDMNKEFGIFWSQCHCLAQHSLSLYLQNEKARVYPWQGHGFLNPFQNF